MSEDRSRSPLLGLGLFLGFQVLYAAAVLEDFPLIGDAADYASLVLHGRFDHQTTHIGFYVVYYALHQLNVHLLGLDPAFFFNLATTTIAALCAPLVAAVLRELLVGDAARVRRTAALGAVLFGSCGVVWFFSVFAEVQALMLLLLLASLLLFLRHSYAGAGVVLALAALVSQAVAPCGFWFLVLAVTRRVGPKQLATAGAAFVVTFVAGVLPGYEDFLWGGRGLLVLPDVYARVGLPRTIGLLGYAVLESFWLLLPLSLLGVIRARRQRDLLWLSLASIPPFLYVGSRIGAVDFGFVFEPLMLLVAAWTALGLDMAARAMPGRLQKVVPVGAVALFALVTLTTYVLPKRHDSMVSNACLPRVHAIAKDGRLITQTRIGFVYAQRFFPEEAVVWKAPWSMPYNRDEVMAILEGDEPVFVLDHSPRPHPLRWALFSNPVARATLSEEQRDRYLDPLGKASEELMQHSPRRDLEPVLRCGDLSLFAVADSSAEDTWVDAQALPE